jgi:hypothetical protein
MTETISQAANGGTREQGPSNPQRAANKEAFDKRVEEIRAHPDLSDEAKKRYLAEAWDEHSAKDLEAASMGHWGLSFEEIVDVLVEFDALMQGIAERYELDPSQLSWISSVDGAIVEKF